jgi:hypothetical protein
LPPDDSAWKKWWRFALFCPVRRHRWQNLFNAGTGNTGVELRPGKFTFQIFSVCGEPQTLQTDSRRYMTPADAAQAGYEAIAANSKVSPDTPIE